MRAGPRTMAGVFLVTLATLMLQILLTRIFSVTMWYHFAFMAVSTAMFGLAVGALLVYLLPLNFPPDRAVEQLAASSLLFSLSVLGSLVLYLQLPAAPGTGLTPDRLGVESPGAATAAHLAFTYGVLAVPFVFSGIAVCLALTRFPGQVGQLYAADLAGAALGCALVIPLLRATDALGAVVVVGALAGAAAVLFAWEAGARALLGAGAVAAVGLAALATAHTRLAEQRAPLLRIAWAKGGRYAPPLYERWNSFAHIEVKGNPEHPTPPVGWGMSAAFRPTLWLRQLNVAIDAGASTVMTAFDGDLAPLGHLRFDVTNLAHHLRSDGRVLVVGVGGGRDLLSALVFGHEQVVGVEINGELLEALRGPFADFTGHLHLHPAIRLVHDEARSFASRASEPFDVIQLSMTDTWAATAAGAFALTENGLYTVEAWETLLARLRPDGLLSVSRWYDPERPAELQRLTALAAAAARRAGAADPRRHIAALTNHTEGGARPRGVGTLLLSPTPLSERDLAALRSVSRRLRFPVLVDPQSARDATFARLAGGRDLEALAAELPFDVSPPTDDRPFFFHMLRLRDAFAAAAGRGLVHDVNLQAVRMLGALLALVSLLMLAIAAVPGALTPRAARRGSAPLVTFFAAIGCGFMLVEISQLQRLIVFLGHPVYGLSVVLFALLLSSGVGSWLARGDGAPSPGDARRRLGALLAVLVLFGLATPALAEAFRGAETPVRIAVATGSLLPLGLFMGMAFPLGMRLASARSPTLTPWLWGVNGGMGIAASVLAVAIALAAGIAAAFWSGVACYALAAAAFGVAQRR